MNFIDMCGKVAILVSCAIVLIFVVLLILGAFCVGMGAYESATNPHAAQDTQTEYQNVSEQINHGASQIQIQINKTGV
jgi:Na+-transporting methylmalonyl-CoA/oxaloacetate decarboxylase gamma subunit